MKRLLALVMVAVFFLAGCGGGGDGGESSPSAAAEGLECLPMDPSGWTPSEGLSGLVPVQLAANDEAAVFLGLRAGLAVAYHSSDGQTWEPSEGFASESLDEWSTISVAGGPKGFVAIGTPGEPQETEDGLVWTPVVQFSADGSSWEQIEPDSLLGSQAVWLTGVSAGPEGFVIVGTDFAGAPDPATVWFSVDGRTWTAADLPASPGAVTVTAADSGWAAIAAGSFGTGVWTSSDGLRWSEVETEAEAAPPAWTMLEAQDTAPLAVTDDTWVIALGGLLGYSQQLSRLVLWVSHDNGVSWSEHVVSDEPGGQGWWTSNVAVTDYGFLVAGLLDTPAGPDGPFVYYSDDAATWQQCWTEPFEFASIDVLGDTVLAGADGPLYVWNQP